MWGIFSGTQNPTYVLTVNTEKIYKGQPVLQQFMEGETYKFLDLSDGQ